MSGKAVDEVINRAKRMPGVVDAIPLDNKERTKIEELEKEAESHGAVKGMMRFVNEGVWEVLKREHLIVVLADDEQGFRPPPEPWVVICDENDDKVGEWLPPEKREKLKGDPSCLFVSDDFVLYKDKYKKGDVYFLMPPIPFPEVEEVEGVKDVISGTTSAPADIYLKEILGYTGYNYWTILVGWNES